MEIQGDLNVGYRYLCSIWPFEQISGPRRKVESLRPGQLHQMVPSDVQSSVQSQPNKVRDVLNVYLLHRREAFLQEWLLY